MVVGHSMYLNAIAYRMAQHLALPDSDKQLSLATKLAETDGFLVHRVHAHASQTAPPHADDRDVFVLQLHGRKDILLFPPTTPGMRTFPCDHPYYTRSQLDLERRR